MEKISEKDLYVFCFCPEKLSDSKFEAISDNEESFRSQLEQLQKMNNYLASFETGQLPSKILRKIKEIERGSNLLEKKMRSGKPMNYFIYTPKSRKKSKKILG